MPEVGRALRKIFRAEDLTVPMKYQKVSNPGVTLTPAADELLPFADASFAQPPSEGSAAFRVSQETWQNRTVWCAKK